jgi:hypothetical protein
MAKLATAMMLYVDFEVAFVEITEECVKLVFNRYLTLPCLALS